MNIENVFSTQERVEILKAVLFRTGQLSVNQIASELNLSKGLVSKYLDLLVQEGLAKRQNGKFIVNESVSIVKGIKILLNLEKTDLGFLKKYSFVEAAGLYGSCVKGENTQDSDVDLWILVKETTDTKKAELAADLRRRVQKVKALFLTQTKLQSIRNNDELFYHALSFGSISLYGASNALEL